MLIDGGYWHCEEVPRSMITGDERYPATPEMKAVKAVTMYAEVNGKGYALHRTLEPLAGDWLGEDVLTTCLSTFEVLPKIRVNGR